MESLINQLVPRYSTIYTAVVLVSKFRSSSDNEKPRLSATNSLNNLLSNLDWSKNRSWPNSVRDDEVNRLEGNKPTVAYTSGTGIWSILSQAGRNQRTRSSSALNCRQVACNLARDNYTREFHFRPPIPISDLLACRCSERACSLSYRLTTMSSVPSLSVTCFHLPS